jgi:hypothetical protein
MDNRRKKNPVTVNQRQDEELNQPFHEEVPRKLPPEVALGK